MLARDRRATGRDALGLTPDWTGEELSVNKDLGTMGVMSSFETTSEGWLRSGQVAVWKGQSA